MRAVRGLKKVDVAGSYRRGRETIGDIDLVATTANAAAAIKAFVSYPDVAQVTAEGSTRATVILRGGVQADLRVVAPESYGAALYYFTGSKAHNIAVRLRAQRRGLKVNEYGVFKGDRRIAGETEDSVFAAVGLPYIPPELREDRGEIDAAEKKSLPSLVRRADLCGDLHSHTKASDGQDSLADMAAAAQANGLQYLAITEHTRRLTVAHGLDSRGLGRLCEAIDRLNEKMGGCTVLKGIEVDILEDGRLDLTDTALGELDLVVAAVHSHFELPAPKQTARILRAMDHKHFSILAHPTGRLLGQREMSRFDVDRIIGAAKDRGCFLEINSQPDRLDLADVYCRTAKAAGVLLSIGSDAHSTAQLDFLEFGVLQARRGWLEKSDILNSRPLQRLRPLLARTM
jgi:DNA polymerase (family 10)